MLHEVKQRSFKDTIGSSAELAVYNYKDSFKDIRLLQHLKRAGEMFEEQKWNSFSVRYDAFSNLVGPNMDKSEAPFMHASSKFMQESNIWRLRN